MPTSLPRPAPVSPADEPRLRACLDGKAKPPGSLGRMEDLAIRLALIRGEDAPPIAEVPLLIFAADHGIVADGVSAYPQAVTAAMVATILDGRSCASAFAAAIGSGVTVVDVGVAADLPPHPHLVCAKVRHGTRNAAREAALSDDEVDRALGAGVKAAEAAIARGADAVALGEMGIGNTATAALLVHRLLPAPLDECVGRGAGQDEAGLRHKRSVLGRAAGRTAETGPRRVLAEFGGLEVAAMAGAVLACAAASRPVVVDGFIAGAAALAAIRLAPEAAHACVFAHRSAEAGHGRLLAGLGVEPLLDLGMRLGEGTGALLAVPLLWAASRLLGDVAALHEVLPRAP